MAADGVFSTPSDAILWAIYTDLHGSATRGAELESGQLFHSKTIPLIYQWRKLSEKGTINIALLLQRVICFQFMHMPVI